MTCSTRHKPGMMLYNVGCIHCAKQLRFILLERIFNGGNEACRQIHLEDRFKCKRCAKIIYGKDLVNVNFGAMWVNKSHSKLTTCNKPRKRAKKKGYSDDC